jgi:ribonuclease HI
MQAQSPHFLLYSEASVDGGRSPQWKFVLQSIGEEVGFTAADSEPETRASRLELLAVVRGLEALGQPSRVTLLTRSRYVRRGIRRELNHWRDRRWRWERFGKLVPIRDHDLWQRVDRALQFHQVECCAWEHDDRCASESRPTTTGFLRRASCRRSTRWQQPGGAIAAVLGRLRRTVLTPISAIWRPPFTRAA